MENFVSIKNEDIVNNYDISDRGNIRNRTSGRILKLQINKRGYVAVSMMRPNGKPITLIVHRLVAKAFISNTKKLRDVNHIDGVKTNNHVKNLEWCSHSENIIHAQNLGLKKDEKEVYAIYIATQEKFLFKSLSEAARNLNTHRGNINGVLKGRRKSCKGYHFLYV